MGFVMRWLLRGPVRDPLPYPYCGGSRDEAVTQGTVQGPPAAPSCRAAPPLEAADDRRAAAELFEADGVTGR